MTNILVTFFGGHVCVCVSVELSKFCSFVIIVKRVSHTINHLPANRPWPLWSAAQSAPSTKKKHRRRARVCEIFAEEAQRLKNTGPARKKPVAGATSCSSCSSSPPLTTAWKHIRPVGVLCVCVRALFTLIQ